MRDVLRLRGGLSALAGLAVLAVAATVVPSGLSVAAPTVKLVNMGDSYSAGASVLPPVLNFAPECSQSQLNWGHDIAKQLGDALTDVSCSGAQTKDFFVAQFPGAGPQLDALPPDANTVTLTIGGNDSGVFTDAIVDCATLGTASAGQGNPCQQKFGDSFDTTIRTTTEPAIVRVLTAIKTKAPQATIGISGYLSILPPTTGCFPIIPIASGDDPYLRDVEATLNNAVKQAASETGTTYIDVSAISEGHDGCQPIGVRWIEPPVGSAQPITLHPNAIGEQMMANQAISVLKLR